MQIYSTIVIDVLTRAYSRDSQFKRGATCVGAHHQVIRRSLLYLIDLSIMLDELANVARGMHCLGKAIID